jgi:hypothetical protein
MMVLLFCFPILLVSPFSFSFRRGAGRLFLVCQKEIEVDFLMVPFFGGGREGVWGIWMFRKAALDVL